MMSLALVRSPLCCPLLVSQSLLCRVLRADGGFGIRYTPEHDAFVQVCAIDSVVSQEIVTSA